MTLGALDFYEETAMKKSNLAYIVEVGADAPEEKDKASGRDRQRLTESILEALSALPPDEYKVFVGYHYEGLRLKELARLLNRRRVEVEETLMSANRFFFAFLNEARRRSP